MAVGEPAGKIFQGIHQFIRPTSPTVAPRWPGLVDQEIEASYFTFNRKFHLQHIVLTTRFLESTNHWSFHPNGGFFPRKIMGTNHPPEHDFLGFKSHVAFGPGVFWKQLFISRTSNCRRCTAARPLARSACKFPSNKKRSLELWLPQTYPNEK